MSEGNDDLFEDTSASTAKSEEGESKTFDEPAKDEKPEADTAKGADAKEGETGAKDKPDGTPPEGKEGEGKPDDGKMIPEHRFKAAIKDVQDKLDAATQEIATLKAAPVPDKDKDPEGYNLHVRMEASKAVMREFKPDYDKVIAHFVEMAKANPYLNEKVAEHPLPAKFAYDLAAKDMEIQELSTMKNSPEYKEFQEWQKAKKAEADAAAKAAEEGGSNKVSEQVTASLTAKVPNLNRATDVSKSAPKSEQDDELFAGAL